MAIFFSLNMETLGKSSCTIYLSGFSLEVLYGLLIKGRCLDRAQVVGWPPIRSFRKNTMASSSVKNSDDTKSKSELGCLYIKVSLDGAPYLRKVDLKTYANYAELAMALEKMFSCFTIGK